MSREPATVLALNPGSSSLKAAVRNPDPVLSITVERLGTDAGTMSSSGDGTSAQHEFSGGIAEAIDAVAAQLRERELDPGVVAHRVVHGGPKHYAPTIVDDALVADLRAAIPLAPLHLPGDLDAIAHARRAWPDAVHVACFDTGFHHDLPDVSRELPVADELRRQGVRRYGFHGLSIQSVLDRYHDLGDAVIAHLGSGCSVTAVGADCRPRHTTMSLTPTGGMMSATRTGDIDPEIVLYLIQQHGYSVDHLRNIVDRRSGLAGLADGRHDLRDLLGASDVAAALAVDMFAAAAAMAIASCVTALDGWDTLVFTGGVGEHADSVRERICARLLPLRGSPPAAPDADAVRALAATGVRTLVVTADEEGVMDRLARELVGG